MECKVDGKTSDSIVHINKLEWQTIVLAPRILMPYKTFSQEAYNLINIFTSGNNCDTIDILPDVIDSLSRTFKVPKFSVKIRLVDIGIIEDADASKKTKNSEGQSKNSK